MKTVKGTASKLSGSEFEKIAFSKKFRGMVFAKGAPTFWITINPDAAHSPLFRFMMGKDIDPQKVETYISQMDNLYELHRDVVQNPRAATLYFHTVVKAVFRYLFAFSEKEGHSDSKGGIFGHTRAYQAVVETTQTGRLHLHVLLWCNWWPEKLRDKLFNNPEFRITFTKYINSVVSASVPGEAAPTIPDDGYLVHPCLKR